MVVLCSADLRVCVWWPGRIQTCWAAPPCRRTETGSLNEPICLLLRGGNQTGREHRWATWPTVTLSSPPARSALCHTQPGGFLSVEWLRGIQRATWADENISMSAVDPQRIRDAQSRGIREDLAGLINNAETGLETETCTWKFWSVFVYIETNKPNETCSPCALHCKITIGTCLWKNKNLHWASWKIHSLCWVGYHFFFIGSSCP